MRSTSADHSDPAAREVESTLGREPSSVSQTSTFQSFPRANNLDLLRLLFALQVSVVHGLQHFKIGSFPVLEHFPGVPAFFFLSGFLIYAAYQKTGLREYSWNRFLRLFPGLFFVTVGGAAVAVLSLGWHDLLTHPRLYAGWFVAQVTLGQAYNPAHFRSVGVGVINGSLWTLTVEILFYIAVPVLAALEKRFRHTVVVLGALSFLVYTFGPMTLTHPFGPKTLYDAVALTPIPWGWMFASGILAVKHFKTLPLKYAPWLFVPMILLAIIDQNGAVFSSWGNRLGILYFIPYCGVLLWLAFRSRAVRLPADLSYGLYIWHMPVINAALVLGYVSPWTELFVLPMALLSWYLVEKPCLRLKHRSLRAMPSTTRPASDPVATPQTTNIMPTGVNE